MAPFVIYGLGQNDNGHLTSKVSPVPAGAGGECAGCSVSLPEMEEDGRREETRTQTSLPVIMSCLWGMCGVAGGQGWWGYGVMMRSMAAAAGGEWSGVESES